MSEEVVALVHLGTQRCSPDNKALSDTDIHIAGHAHSGLVTCPAHKRDSSQDCTHTVRIVHTVGAAVAEIIVIVGAAKIARDPIR